MQKQEFEERIERTVTDEQYKVIEEVYMWHPSIRNTSGKDDYTIPRNNRELQLDDSTTVCSLIIPYQEITGNYSCQGWYGILESLSIPQNKKKPLLRII